MEESIENNFEALKLIRTQLLDVMTTMQASQMHITNIDLYNRIVGLLENVETALRGELDTSLENQKPKGKH